MAERFVAIQLGAASFIDEGVSPVLDTFQERGAVNALFLATPTWTRGTGGRQLPGYSLPDHGVQEHDLGWGGAQGVVLSRKYSEMRLQNLSGAGDAIRELGG